MFTRVKTPAEIVAMCEGGHMLAAVLKKVSGSVKPGVNTQKLADIAAAEVEKLGGKPAFLGYQDFPDVLCVSVNNEVVHGIPDSEKIIKNGDIVSLDFGVLHKGLITDGAISVIAGKASAEDQKLVEVTKKSLHAGIKAVKAGCHIGDISQAVEKVLRQSGYGIVEELVGHGVGDNLHEGPDVPNYGKAGKGPILEAGMTIAIEPMATLGGHEVYIDTDRWTVKTMDSTRAAHFEHTVLVTKNGHEILTQI